MKIFAVIVVGLGLGGLGGWSLTRLPPAPETAKTPERTRSFQGPATPQSASASESGPPQSAATRTVIIAGNTYTLFQQDDPSKYPNIHIFWTSSPIGRVQLHESVNGVGVYVLHSTGNHPEHPDSALRLMQSNGVDCWFSIAEWAGPGYGTLYGGGMNIVDLAGSYTGAWPISVTAN